MSIKSLKDSFIKFCEINKFEKNVNQLKIVDLLINFINSKSKFFHQQQLFIKMDHIKLLKNQLQGLKAYMERLN